MQDHAVHCKDQQHPVYALHFGTLDVDGDLIAVAVGLADKALNDHADGQHRQQHRQAAGPDSGARVLADGIGANRVRVLGRGDKDEDADGEEYRRGSDVPFFHSDYPRSGKQKSSQFRVIPVHSSAYLASSAFSMSFRAVPVSSTGSMPRLRMAALYSSLATALAKISLR